MNSDSTDAQQNHVTTTGEDGERRRVVMQVDESGKAPTYANAFQVQAGPTEVVLDFGYRTAAGQVNVPSQDGGTESADRLRFLVANRVAMAYPVAKQLMSMLQQALEQAERRASND